MKKVLLMVFLVISSLSAQVKDVTVSILPQKYFVEKIAGDKINVNVMVKPGFSPATYEPKTSQMKKLSSSIVYFTIDVPFEDSWLKKFENANKKMMIVHTSDGIKKIEMQEHSHHEEHKDEHHDEHKDEDGHHDEHDHGKEHKDEDHNEHEGLDPHVWTDPILVKIQAKNIYDALVKVDNKNALFYKKNYESFLLELDLLHKKIETILKPYKDKAFMVFHPSWGYFAKRYSLEQFAIESEGKEPKPKELVELIKDAKEHNIKVVFVAPQFSQNSAKTIAKSINGKVIAIDTLSLDWNNSLIKTAEVIANTYK